MRPAAPRDSAHDRASSSTARTDVLDEFEDALRAGEATRWGPLNWHFHAALYAPANRNFTMGVLQKLHQHSDRYFRMQVLLATAARAPTTSIARSRRRCEARTSQRATQLMRAHILGAGTSLLALLQEQRGEHAMPVRSAGP